VNFYEIWEIGRLWIIEKLDFGSDLKDVLDIPSWIFYRIYRSQEAK